MKRYSTLAGVYQRPDGRLVDFEDHEAAMKLKDLEIRILRLQRNDEISHHRILAGFNEDEIASIIKSTELRLQEALEKAGAV